MRERVLGADSITGRANILNRFIILRGPSCAGKSTVAKRLFELSPPGTAFIQQDRYRSILTAQSNGGRPNSEVIHQMIEHNCGCALAAGHDVILEGILTVKKYADVLDRIIAGHAGPSFIFYFDVSLKETLRRRATKKSTPDFSIENMRKWYTACQRSHHRLEQLVPEHFSESDTTDFICRETLLDRAPGERAERMASGSEDRP